MSEKRLRELLRGEPTASEREAEERAWPVVRSAYEGRAGGVAGHPRRALAISLAGAVAVVALVLSPAGAEVREWLADAVEPGVERAAPSLTRLPTDGCLLVESQDGVWIVDAAGSKRLLGDYGQAMPSPAGAFVAAADGHQLVAVVGDPDNPLADGQPAGTVRWTVASDEAVSDPAWAPSGYRVAYLAGSQLRVAAGDGTPDRLVASDVSPVAPAWRPLAQPVPAASDGIGTHQLAFVDQSGDVQVIDTDSGTRRLGEGQAEDAIEVGWTTPWRTPFVLEPRALSLFPRSEGPQLSWEFPKRTRAVAAAASPNDEIAVIRRAGGRAELVVFDARHTGRGPRRLFAADPARFTFVTWSPDGRWILLGWRDADQWVFIRASDGRKVAVSNISAQFDPGATRSAGFPSAVAWCCP